MKLDKKITIVIVTYNARLYLPDCLGSVYRQNYPADMFSVVVIDNNSSDNTIEYIKEAYPQVKVIINRKNLGFAQANNQGYFLAQKNQSDYLVLLNQDTIVEPNWLSHMLSVAENDNKVAMIQPKLLLYPEKNLINSFGNSIHYLGFAFCNFYRAKDQMGMAEPFELPYASGAANLIKMSALEKTGLFDEKLFMYHEDVDLGWRLRLAGYKILLDPLAVVYHKYNYSKAKYKFYYMERNRWILLLENYRIATLIVFAPMLILMEFGQFFYALKNGWIKEKIKGWLWLFTFWPKILARRMNARFEVRNKVKDKEILKLYTGSIKFQELNYPLLTYVVNPLMEVYFWLAKKIIFW